jgi:beta-N-acetylhexosaminidase
MTDLEDARTAVKDGVGGLLLFGSTVPPDLADRLAALTALAPDGLRPLVATDEEGGSVQRMRGLVGALPSARTLGATLTPDEIRSLAARIGRDMAAAGITVDLAPVLDLDDTRGPSRSNPVGTRSFGLDPAAASADGLAFAAGLLDSGVVPSVKHFPGLGGANGNTDDELASTLPWPVLREAALLPFRDAIAVGIPSIMVANAIVPGLTRRPASVSPEVITGVLRGELGFDGVVVTDSLSARSLTDAGYSVPEAAVAALNAGADLVLYATGPESDAVTTRTIAAIAKAVDRSRLEEAVGRVLALKGVDLCAAA